ncbi:MAG: DUF5312 domain-containing protein [Treponema sp.]|nr:DUF5312 domain-containing protein [Treponema sp.]
MEESQKKSTFDRLVAGMNSDERTAMLARLNQSGEKDIELLNSSAEVDTFTGTLSLRLKNESIFYKFYIWIRSFFSKAPQIQIYNDDILLSMAKKINREHPGILSPQGEYLDSLFYDRLQALKQASDFFKPYIYLVEENPGAFYVFLSSFVAPQLSDSINSTCDPYNIPQEIDPTNDIKNDLLKKMDDILKNMHGSIKTNIYQAIKSIQWLRSFTGLPFVHFISQFTDIKDNVFTCSYSSAKIDYELFASVFDSPISVPNEILEALFLFSQKKEMMGNYMTSDIENAVKKFMSVATSHFSSIKLFLSVVPVTTMGRIIFKDYDWNPKPAGGAEDWFPKFRTQWRKILEIRWTEFLKERQKNRLQFGLQEDFNLSSFPELPNRPWLSLWGGVPFNCEMTAGLLGWYVTNLYTEDQKALNLVSMEGIFVKSENRTEYADALDNLHKACNQVMNTLENLEFKGSYGNTFEEVSSSLSRNFKSQTTIDNLISKIEGEFLHSAQDICNAIRILEANFKGIFEEVDDGVHDPLTNLNTIKGHDNIRFKDDLKAARIHLKQLLFYLTEIEPLDKKN